MQDTDGTPRLLYARVCRPGAPARVPVVVMMHGTGVDSIIIQPPNCDNETPEWFLKRGYAVVMPLRRGFGATGGVRSDLTAVKPSGRFTCDQTNQFLMGREGARDVAAAVDYATALPFARPDGAVVVGASTGGFVTTAYDSVPHPKVAALINVSGGIGGAMGGNIGQVCHPERLVEAMGRFGATASTPMIWLYADNDFYFSPDLAQAMHAAFTASGGKAELVMTGVFGANGHALFAGGRGGSYLWGPPVERYLAQQHAQAPALE